MHDEFEMLSRKIADARKKCEAAYFAWTTAAHELKQLERDRTIVWGKMLDSVTVALPKAQKTL